MPTRSSLGAGPNDARRGFTVLYERRSTDLSRSTTASLGLYRSGARHPLQCGSHPRRTYTAHEDTSERLRSAMTASIGTLPEGSEAPKPIRKIIHVDMDAFYASVEQRD